MLATLDSIMAATRRRVARAQGEADMRQLERKAAQHAPRAFGKHLRGAGGVGLAVIAELKKESPSRGTIRPDFDAAQLAAELQEAGAAALSVLTDEEFFRGWLENLWLASELSLVPCL